jgi:hypothetical protein
MLAAPKRAQSSERKLIALHAATAARAVIGNDVPARDMVSKRPLRDPEKLCGLFRVQPQFLFIDGSFHGACSYAFHLRV